MLKNINLQILYVLFAQFFATSQDFYNGMAMEL